MLRPVQLALDDLADLAVMFPFLIIRTQSMPAKICKGFGHTQKLPRAAIQVPLGIS